MHTNTDENLKIPLHSFEEKVCSLALFIHKLHPQIFMFRHESKHWENNWQHINELRTHHIHPSKSNILRVQELL